MATPQHLKNAPIVEAVLSLHVKQSANFTPDRVKFVHNQLLKRFPSTLEVHTLERSIQFVPGKSPDTKNTDKGVEGYQMRSPDNLNAVHVMNGFFGFSRLSPYTEWDNVEKECRDLWTVYVACTQPELVTKIAVRFLNRIAIPLPQSGEINFREYLTAGPEAPPELPSVMNGFMKMVMLRDPNTDIIVNISQATENTMDRKNLYILLDILAQKTQDFPVQDAEIWSSFKKLREIKNLAFFSSITDKTKEMFL